MAEAVEEYWAERTEEEQVEGNIVYDEAAAQAVRETTIAVESIFSKAAEAIANAQTVLSNTPEAGGNLGTDSGRTILGNIIRELNDIREVLDGITKMRKAWEQIMEIMGNARSRVSSESRNRVWTMLETVTSLTDDETVELVGSACDIIGGMIRVGSKDEITGVIGGNLGGIVRAFASTYYDVENSADEYFGRVDSGEIGYGEAIAGTAAAYVTHSVIGLTDTFTNMIGVDIPDSFRRNAATAMGQLGEKAYQVFSGAFKSGWGWSSLAA